MQLPVWSRKYVFSQVPLLSVRLKFGYLLLMLVNCLL